jgi:hypothetical protein
LAISFAWPTLAQQVDLDAARRAKAAAGREALTHAAAKVLAPVGSFTTFDVPGAVNGTFPSSINPAGAITGSYYDVNFVGHGFLRAKNGTLVSFDAPGAGTTDPSFPGTYAVSINPAGAIVGMYTDANSLSHGFVRASDGTFTTFDPPGKIAAFAPFALAQTSYINPDGVITGAYFESISGNPFRADPRRRFHHIRCSDLSPLLCMVVSLRYYPGGRDHRILQRWLYH